jgi:alpha-L-rhamnosidase
MNMRFLLRGVLLILIGFVLAFESVAQLTDRINPVLLNQAWDARWITCPGVSGEEFGVYLFRKDFTLEEKAGAFVVHVSADNRYKLYVNEQYIANGPARGDEMHWRFESLDIAPYLKKGKNVITAVVWNFAGARPMAQHSAKTGFILQGNGDAERVLNTDKSWVVVKDAAYGTQPGTLSDYTSVGPGEKFDGRLHPWKWMQQDFDRSAWKQAAEQEEGHPLKSLKHFGDPTAHVLVPRTIPMMEETVQRFFKVCRADLSTLPKEFPKAKKAFTVPARSKVKILLDQDHLTNAYPVLQFSKGKDSEIKMTYAESLKDGQGNKGNRDEFANKTLTGNQDLVISSGSDQQVFQSLWWRTFRYVEVEIETREEALTIDDLYSIFTGYPLAEKAVFRSDDPLIKNIWEVGWRTQRLCAGETFFDCPYYEQLQYVGDARIQCFVSSYVSGDLRMMRNALTQIDDSRLSSGLTQARYPSYGVQMIPTFSLVWVTMIHDYWMLSQDDAYVRSAMPAILGVLQWFESHIDSSGMIGQTEYWNFVDWTGGKHWDAGAPTGQSSVMSLQYVYTIQKAAELLNAFQFKDQATRYTALADKIRTSVYTGCYDKSKGLIADSPQKDGFSQHANILAVLTNTVAAEAQSTMLDRLRKEKDLAKSTYYFNFYLIEALEKAGMGGQFMDELGPWKQMLDIGLTTFAENPEPTRSDCHAWSASPLYYFLSLVCGIKPNEPGFASVRIQPNPGSLQRIEGSMPHHLGTISVNLKKDKQNNLTGEITLPGKLTGVFVWNGKTTPLKGGVNQIR